MVAWRFAPHNHADQPDITRPKLHFVRARRLSATPLDAPTIERMELFMRIKFNEKNHINALLLAVLILLISTSVYANTIELDLGANFDSESDKETIELEGLKITKKNGDMIEVEKYKHTKKKSRKKGKGRLKGSIDPEKKSGKVNLSSSVTGTMDMEIDITLADGSVVSRSFNDVQFIESFVVNLTLDSGVISSFELTGESEVLSLDFPELDFETGMGVISYPGGAQLIDLFIDSSFPFDVGAAANIRFETNQNINFDNIQSTFALRELSTTVISVIPAPSPLILLCSGLALLLRRTSKQKLYLHTM
ncbi:MAG: hypothetical protein H6974_04965 [Gammaproteobacteria bacterium]|nr:hypothetical protein [Gammaproteobacteria bacterium]MCP5196132.1 hypothetical protein [Gammaproteobacteria bacterium]